MADDSLMKTPGELLGQARESQGLSLEALAERTKIPVKVLAALEMDEYHKVSGPLYIKSFLRTCATDLGLDADHVLDLYSRFGGEAGAPTGEGDMVWQEEQVKVTHVGLPWPKILMVGGAAVVVLGLVLFLVRGCGDGEPVEPDSTPTQTVEENPPEDPRRGSLLAADTSGAAMDADVTTEETDQSDLVMTEETVTIREEDPPASRPDPAPAQETAEPVVEEARPVERDTRPAAENRTTTSSSPPVPGSLPAAVSGNAGTPFADGQAWPVVMRLITDLPLVAEVRRDGETEFQTAAWTDPVALPMREIRPGRAYGVREGLVVYWGARDHFSLRLDRVVGVEVSINGVVRDISSLRPGQEIILDDHSAADERR